MCFYHGRFYMACNHFEFSVAELCKPMAERGASVPDAANGSWRGTHDFLDEDCQPRVFILEHVHGRPVVLEWRSANDTSITNIVEWAEPLPGGWCTRCFNAMRTSTEAGLLALQQGARIMYHMTPGSRSIFDIQDTRPILWYPAQATTTTAAAVQEVKKEEEEKEKAPEDEQSK
ncbi:hypothetical protein N7488_000413 [Penicillium malachiteum]|nr:hypothetical protein N7488_000413 [Penicillium malachiteum]